MRIDECPRHTVESAPAQGQAAMGLLSRMLYERLREPSKEPSE